MNNTFTILLIDDNDIDLMIGERLISVVNPDVKVNGFTRGQRALDWLKDLGSDCLHQKVVLFIDIYMNEMNGFEVAHRATQLIESFGCEAECYLLSATIDDSDLRRIKNDPKIKGFIGKPITQDVLNNIVLTSKSV